MLYLEKIPRRGKLHALLGCPEEDTENFFFRIPVEDFSPPPRPGTAVSFSHYRENCSGPVGFKKKYPCPSGFAPVFLSVGSETPFTIRGRCADSPINPRKIFFEWSPIGSDPTFTIKYSFFRNEFPKKLFFGVEAETSLTLSNRKNATGIHPFLDRGVYHGDMSIHHVPPPTPTPTEPTDFVPPPSFLKELSTAPLFNFLFAIGIPENSAIPTLGFADFLDLSKDPKTSLHTFEEAVLKKYTLLAKDERAPLAPNATTFLRRLAANKGNKNASNKGVLIFTGRWPGLDLKSSFSLASRFVETKTFSVFLSASAHPLSTPENCAELNPHVCGNSTAAFIENRFFLPKIGFGEELFSGADISFGLFHNQKHLFLLKWRAPQPLPPSSPMFFPPTHYIFTEYAPPPAKFSGSENGDGFFLASFDKTDKGKNLEALHQAGVTLRALPDPDQVSPVFQNFQIFSPDLSFENLSHITPNPSTPAPPPSKNFFVALTLLLCLVLLLTI